MNNDRRVADDGDGTARLSPGPFHSARATSTAGRVIYAIGDIHGCYTQFASMLQQIVYDVEITDPKLRPLLVFCGDYVDRGPSSAAVISAMIWIFRHCNLEVTFLRGNHEEMLLEFVTQPEESLQWLRRDGHHTLRSYGVVFPSDNENDFEKDIIHLRDMFLDLVPASHLNFMRTLPIKRVCGDYVFVHAGLRPGVPIEQQSEHDCTWIGSEFLDADYRFEKVVVHGHSWSSELPMVLDNRIGIDTGVYATGRLTGVRLEGSSIKILQSVGKP